MKKYRIIKIEKCCNCPFVHFYDGYFTTTGKRRNPGYQCNNRDLKYNRLIRYDIALKTVPDWCPLEKGDK
jgi:hypothetical protein